jgi:uncharacterized heparinase superfamily protein
MPIQLYFLPIEILALHQPMFGKIKRLYHTLKYLKSTQVIGRAIHYMPLFIKEQQNAPLVSKNCPLTVAYIEKPCSSTDFEKFNFLNEVHALQEIGWESNEVSKLWVYNLHYFDYINSTNKDLAAPIIEQWVKQNPFHAGTGWEPYPNSIRIVNWVKWHRQSQDGLNKSALLSLWNQLRFLSARPEYHLLGNHLFTNAKALLMGAVFFEGEEAKVIYNHGKQIFEDQFSEQYLQDGGHFEQSPMYHALCLEDLMDIYNYVSPHDPSLPNKAIAESIQKGIYWLLKMSYANGEVAYFNDSSNGIAPTLVELEAYALRLGLTATVRPVERVTHFKDTGYVVVEDDRLKLIADVGKIGPDYIPGHAHADSLSFELMYNGFKVIGNHGTSVYGTGADRQFERGTAAHSTVVVDGKNSSDVWGGFRVGERAYTRGLSIDENNSLIQITCAHDGYNKAGAGLIHKRKWIIEKGQCVIADELLGNVTHALARFIIHPAVQVMRLEDGSVDFVLPDKTVVQVVSKQKAAIVDFTYARSFGVVEATKAIDIAFTHTSSIVFKFK